MMMPRFAITALIAVVITALASPTSSQESKTLHPQTEDRLNDVDINIVVDTDAVVQNNAAKAESETDDAIPHVETKSETEKRREKEIASLARVMKFMDTSVYPNAIVNVVTFLKDTDVHAKMSPITYYNELARTLTHNFSAQEISVFTSGTIASGILVLDKEKMMKDKVFNKSSSDENDHEEELRKLQELENEEDYLDGTFDGLNLTEAEVEEYRERKRRADPDLHYDACTFNADGKQTPAHNAQSVEPQAPNFMLGRTQLGLTDGEKQCNLDSASCGFLPQHQTIHGISAAISTIIDTTKDHGTGYYGNSRKMRQLNAVVETDPIAVIIGNFAFVVEALIGVPATISETLRNLFTNIFAARVDAAGNQIDSAKNIITNLVEFMTTLMDGFSFVDIPVAFFKNLFEGLFVFIKDELLGAFQLDKLFDFFTTLFTAMKPFIDVIAKIFEMIVDFISSFGIIDAAIAVIDGIISAVQDVINYFQGLFRRNRRGVDGKSTFECEHDHGCPMDMHPPLPDPFAAFDRIRNIKGNETLTPEIEWVDPPTIEEIVQLITLTSNVMADYNKGIVNAVNIHAVINQKNGTIQEFQDENSFRNMAKTGATDIAKLHHGMEATMNVMNTILSRQQLPLDHPNHTNQSQFINTKLDDHDLLWKKNKAMMCNRYLGMSQGTDSADMCAPRPLARHNVRGRRGLNVGEYVQQIADIFTKLTAAIDFDFSSVGLNFEGLSTAFQSVILGLLEKIMPEFPAEKFENILSPAVFMDFGLHIFGTLIIGSVGNHVLFELNDFFPFVEMFQMLDLFLKYWVPFSRFNALTTRKRNADLTKPSGRYRGISTTRESIQHEFKKMFKDSGTASWNDVDDTDAQNDMYIEASKGCEDNTYVTDDKIDLYAYACSSDVAAEIEVANEVFYFIDLMLGGMDEGIEFVEAIMNDIFATPTVGDFKFKPFTFPVMLIGWLFSLVKHGLSWIETHCAVEDGDALNSDRQATYENTKFILQKNTVQIAQTNEISRHVQTTWDTLFTQLNSRIGSQQTHIDMLLHQQQEQADLLEKLILLTTKLSLTPKNERPLPSQDDLDMYRYAIFRKDLATPLFDDKGIPVDPGVNRKYDAEEERTFDTVLSLLNANRFPLHEDLSALNQYSPYLIQTSGECATKITTVERCTLAAAALGRTFSDTPGTKGGCYVFGNDVRFLDPTTLTDFTCTEGSPCICITEPATVFNTLNSDLGVDFDSSYASNPNGFVSQTDLQIPETVLGSCQQQPFVQFENQLFNAGCRPPKDEFSCDNEGFVRVGHKHCEDFVSKLEASSSSINSGTYQCVDANAYDYQTDSTSETFDHLKYICKTGTDQDSGTLQEFLALVDDLWEGDNNFLLSSIYRHDTPTRALSNGVGLVCLGLQNCNSVVKNLNQFLLSPRTSLTDCTDIVASDMGVTGDGVFSSYVSDNAEVCDGRHCSPTKLGATCIVGYAPIDVDPTFGAEGTTDLMCIRIPSSFRRFVDQESGAKQPHLFAWASTDASNLAYSPTRVLHREFSDLTSSHGIQSACRVTSGVSLFIQIQPQIDSVPTESGSPLVMSVLEALIKTHFNALTVCPGNIACANLDADVTIRRLGSSGTGPSQVVARIDIKVPAEAIALIKTLQPATFKVDANARRYLRWARKALLTQLIEKAFRCGGGSCAIRTAGTAAGGGGKYITSLGGVEVNRFNLANSVEAPAASLGATTGIVNWLAPGSLTVSDGAVQLNSALASDMTIADISFVESDNIDAATLPERLNDRWLGRGFGDVIEVTNTVDGVDPVAATRTVTSCETSLNCRGKMLGNKPLISDTTLFCTTPNCNLAVFMQHSLQGSQVSQGDVIEPNGSPASLGLGMRIEVTLITSIGTIGAFKVIAAGNGLYVAGETLVSPVGWSRFTVKSVGNVVGGGYGSILFTSSDSTFVVGESVTITKASTSVDGRVDTVSSSGEVTGVTIGSIDDLVSLSGGTPNYPALKSDITISNVGGGTAAAEFHTYPGFQLIDRPICCEEFICAANCGACLDVHLRTSDNQCLQQPTSCPVGEFAVRGMAFVFVGGTTAFPSWTCVPLASGAVRRQRRNNNHDEATHLDHVQPSISNSAIHDMFGGSVDVVHSTGVVTARPDDCGYDVEGDDETGANWFDWNWEPCATCVGTWHPNTSIGGGSVCVDLLPKARESCSMASVTLDSHAHTRNYSTEFSNVTSCNTVSYTFASASDVVNEHSASDVVNEHSDASSTPQPQQEQQGQTTQKLLERLKTGSTIDVMNIDCNGCEYELLCSDPLNKQILETSVRQITLRTTWSPETPALWKCIAESGLVPFSKTLFFNSNNEATADISLLNLKLANLV